MFWAATAGWAGAIWLASTMTLGDVPVLRLPLADKAAHLGIYGVLGFLAAGALRTLRPMPSRWAAGHGAVLIAALWGWIDEIHQFFVPGRTTEPLDLLADVVGAALGAWLYLKGESRSRRTGKKGC